MKMFKNYALVALLAAVSLTGTGQVNAAARTADDAAQYGRSVLAKFKQLISGIEQSPGKLKVPVAENLKRLFAVEDANEGSLLHLYRSEFATECATEDRGTDWEASSYRKQIFAALIMVLYGNASSAGLFKWATHAVARNLNGQAGRALRLNRTGEDILSRFFMALTAIDGALLLNNTIGSEADRAKVRIDHWMEKVTDCWYVAPTPHNAGSQGAGQDDAPDLDAEEEHEERAGGPRHQWAPNVDPEGILRIHNDGRVVIDNHNQVGVLMHSGGTTQVIAQGGSALSITLDGNVTVDMERNLRGVLGLPAPEERDDVLHARGAGTPGRWYAVRGLLAAGGWLLFDAVSAGGTGEGIVVATALGIGAHWLLGR